VDDAEGVAAVLRQNPHRRTDAAEVRSWLDHAAINPEDLRVLVEDERVVGYVDVITREEVANVDVAGEHREDALLDWAEQRSCDKGASRARVQAWEGQERLTSVLAFGEEPPAAPTWPDGIRARTYRHPEDERLAYELQEETFRDAWDYRATTLEEWRDFQVRRRGFDPALWFLAFGDEQPAGLLLAYPERVGEPDLGFISIVGVRREWRRRGIAEALLRHAFRELHARGLRKVGLGVDAESPTGATRLYDRVGMSVRVRSDTWEKRL
jgi:ribosomal protein S18 acetylase RimI-like enzyme